MLLKIAWNNVWRHKIRSFVVITAIALGLIAGIFASAFVNGMMVQKVDSVVKIEMSHFQLHQPFWFRQENRHRHRRRAHGAATLYRVEDEAFQAKVVCGRHGECGHRARL